jgi:hypothetical protein
MIMMWSARILIFSLFIWAGFVCAISFMEAWLKFRAPGVSVPIGLGIGRIVFSALNKVEWVLLIMSLTAVWLHGVRQIGVPVICLVVLGIILSIQTFWLLPKLDARAEIVISGGIPPASSLHVWFIGLELVKVVLLLVSGFGFFRWVNSIST